MSISTLINSKIINGFSLDDLHAYLSHDRDWDKADSRKGWAVFVGNKRSAANALEIVLPDEYDEYTAPTYIAAALSLLSDIKEEEPILLADSISKYESDLLYVRNTKKGISNSIRLGLAVKQLNELKFLVQYAVDLEKRKLPYDLLQHTSEAKRIVDHYRFGHTFKGSFGFTLEAPLMKENQKRIQIPFDTNISDRTVPPSRKVMERIARGLQYTNESVESDSAKWITNNYKDGFNANMCNALIGVAGDSSTPVEYKVLWSPVMEAARDVARFKPVLIDNSGIDYLKIAEKELKEMRKPQIVKVRGFVKTVSTTEDPLGNIAKREVVLSWINNPFSKRTTNLTMAVDADAYKLAHAININWKKTILVDGEVSYKRSKGWSLKNPRNFRIADKE